MTRHFPRLPRPTGFACWLALLTSALPGAVDAAPITFNTALPVAKGEFLFREQLIVSQSGKDPGNTNRDRSERMAVTALGYGLTRRWALFGVLPYRDIDLDLDSGGQRLHRRNSQLGDLTVFARYSAYQKNQRGRTFRVAPFFGAKLPTGKDHVSDSLGVLPPPAQTSTGAADVFAGLVLTYQTLQYQFDGQVSYRTSNEANGFEAGDIFRVDGSLQYKLWNSKPAGGLPHFLYGVLEVNVINQQKNRINGVSDPNTNGTRVFISPGIQYVTKRWILEGSVQLPLSQNLNGTALETDSIVRVGVRFNF